MWDIEGKVEIINSTKYLFASTPGRMNYPDHSLTFIVKGTFALVPGQKAIPSKEQLYPTGDEHYPDDEDMLGSPRYESDFACFKPKADLLLVGKCHVPSGKPLQSCKVLFQVGSKARALAILGNRQWKRNAFGFRFPTEPEPFKEMELRYENSFGGIGYDRNPVGKGFAKLMNESGAELLPLPNIEDPLELIDSPHSRPEPAGFGPVSRMWELRRSKMGTYRRAYVKERWPWFPEDFDWTHFNAAPPEMQLKGYLCGDEKLYFENIHSDHPQYEALLPGARVRCFLNRSAGSSNRPPDFAEVPMNLDTLWVDMDSEKLVLVWRGWVDVTSEEPEEIQHIFIKSEEIESLPDPIDRCHEQFWAAVAEEKRRWQEGADEPEERETPEAEPAEETETGSRAAEEEQEEEKAREALKTQIESQTANLLSQSGIDLNKMPAEIRSKLDEQRSRMIGILTSKNSTKAKEEEHKQIHSQLSAAFSQLGLDVDDLPPVSEKARAQQIRFLKEMGAGHADITGNRELARYWAIMAAVLPKVGFDPENLDSFIAAAKRQKDRIEKLLGIKLGQEKEEEKAPGEEAPPGTLTREIVQKRAALGDSFAGEDLRNLDLSGLQLKGLDFTGALLAGVSLGSSNLEDANFSEADLAGADLSGSCLKRAILTKANLSKSNLSGARLEEADVTEAVLNNSLLSGAAINNAVFERAKMPDARLDQATAKDAIFAEADLTGASFKKSQVPGADFSKCLLHGADFQGADLSSARLEAASGVKANFREANLSGLRASEGCDFSEGCFVKAAAPGSYWEKAKLQAADFSYARLERANFSKAMLEGANFYASDVKFGRFMKANLRRAAMVQMNLFEGSLEKADLTETDLRGSNLYGAEFLDARLDRTLLENANLKMTKLQKG